MITIWVDQLLSNSAMYEHICLEKIKKLYKSSSKCKNKQQYKAILEADVVQNPEGLTDNIPMSLLTHTRTCKKYRCYKITLSIF